MQHPSQLAASPEDYLQPVHVTLHTPILAQLIVMLGMLKPPYDEHSEKNLPAMFGQGLEHLINFKLHTALPCAKDEFLC
jgi:hypothetical protein